MTKTELAKIIDHTLLDPAATNDGILRLCDEAVHYGFGAVCVAPTWVNLAVITLANSPVKIAAVVGFPHGNTLPSVKSFEASQLIRAGANEIDMVINIGALLSEQDQFVLNDIKGVIESSRKEDETAIIKAIIETALLTDVKKIRACQLIEEAGADYVKTSTGFSLGGATVRDVALVRSVVGNRIGIKAAGGIRDLATAMSMIAAGATRIGCSASVSIINEFPS